MYKTPFLTHQTPDAERRQGNAIKKWIFCFLLQAGLFGRHLLDIGLALEVLALDEVGNVIVILLLVLTLNTLLHALVALGELAKRCERVGAKLVKDAGDELGQLLVLAVAVDGKGVGGNGCVDCHGHVSIDSQVGGGSWQQLTLGGSKVDDVAVRLEHVDLLDGLDGLDVHLLEGGLELLVVTTAGSVDLLDLSSGGTLAAVFRVGSVSARIIC